MKVLKLLLEPVAVDIQHTGNTAITFIHAKLIIDIFVGVHNLDDMLPYVALNHPACACFWFKFVII